MPSACWTACFCDKNTEPPHGPMTTSTILKTEAIALRILPFSNTSHVVSWLSPEFGKLATVVKGAQRPRSLFLGQYDLFYTCELLFYRRLHNTLHVIRECVPLRPRTAFRTDWKAMACASYICDLVGHVGMEGNPQPGLYRLAETCLDFLCQGQARPQLLFWFELQLMKNLGWAPQLSKCPVCGAPPNPPGSLGRPPLAFSPSRGGLLCRKCSGPHGQDAMAVTPDVVAMMESWLKTDSPRSARHTRISPEQMVAFSTILGRFLPYHLDTMPVSRGIAMGMAQAKDPRETAGKAGSA